MRTVLAFSGGLDSTVLLYKLRSEGHEVHPLAVDYGQRHNREIAAAIGLDQTTTVLRINGSMFAKGALTGDEPVPHGHYADATMEATVVPNRNMVLLALCGAYAGTLSADAVAFAAHGGDHPVYRDCRPAFIDAICTAMRLGQDVAVLAPFQAIDKSAIVVLGHELGVPFVQTWSCYEGGEVHCGKCGTCYERREAFDLGHVPDPTVYA